MASRMLRASRRIAASSRLSQTARAAVPKASVRRMGSHAKKDWVADRSGFLPRHPDYPGVEGYLRYAMPEDGELSLGIFTMYVVLVSGYITYSNYVEATKPKPAPQRAMYEEIVEKPPASSVPTMEEDADAWAAFINGGDENVKAYIEAMTGEPQA